MPQFQLLRYLRKWRYVIIAVCLLGCVFVYRYCNNKQRYIATAVIQYTHALAQEGMNPDGSPLDASEMLSNAVISDVIADLDLNINVEDIRARFQITPIISEEEQEKANNLQQSGEDYTYYPTSFIVSFTVGKSSSEEYARAVMDSLLSNYLAFYCEKYVVSSQFPTNADSVLAVEREYVDSVEMLRETLNLSAHYLNNLAQNNGSYFSATTGYSFKAAVEYYGFLLDNHLARLNAYVLDKKLVRNQELLLVEYQNSIDIYQTRLVDLETRIERTKSIIDQFSTKTLEGEYARGYHSDDDEDTTSDGIVVNVNTRRSEDAATQTTYDRLINQYASLLNTKITYENELIRLKELYDLFSSSDVNADPNSEEAKWAQEHIEELVQLINDFHGIAMDTIDNFNQRSGAYNLSMRSSVNTYSKINIARYMALAVIAFVFIGCGLAVLVGRAGDLVDYYIYADQHTGLPNRTRCDMVIDQYAQRLLPDLFCCFALLQRTAYPERPGYTRQKGDEMIGTFSVLVKAAFEDAEFIGYNGSGMFLIFMRSCSVERAQAIVERLSRLVEDSNKDAAFPIDYKVGHAVTSDVKEYSVRDLIRTAIAHYTPWNAEQSKEG